MALAVGGRLAEAERAYEWLAGLQRPDGAWHQYYVADGVEQDKLDANVCAYVATGVWHHLLLTGDDGFAEAMWPVVERAIDFVLDLQTPRGEILWARHADGTPWSFALLDRVVEHVPLAPLRHRPRRAARPRASRLGAVGGPPGRTSSGTEPAAFAPKHRWAMDWYYPVLTGVVARRRRPRPAGRPAFDVRRWTAAACGASATARGSRRPRRASAPWPTSPSASAQIAEELFGWTRQYRDDDGRYWTGTVYPDESRFPPGERSTYTAAAIVLCADAITGLLAGGRALRRPRHLSCPGSSIWRRGRTTTTWMEPRGSERCKGGMRLERWSIVRGRRDARRSARSRRGPRQGHTSSGSIEGDQLAGPVAHRLRNRSRAIRSSEAGRAGRASSPPTMRLVPDPMLGRAADRRPRVPPWS